MRTQVLITTITLILLLISPTFISGDNQPTIEWAAVCSFSQWFEDIAIDNEGNVYVTGYSTGNNPDYITVKYDKNGNELWLARYNGPLDRHDYPEVIAIDSLGNVYVTGRSEGLDTSWDYATVKYDAFGNEVWVARYDGSNDEDEAWAMEAESSGNVYVTGKSKGMNGTFDCVTIKYDSNGNIIWLDRYDSSYDDRGKDVTVDSSGNVYVTGTTWTPRSSTDFNTIKYDNSGNRIWLRTYNGPMSGSDEGRKIVVDSADNIFVAGSSSGGSIISYATLKYDQNGNLLWAALHTGPDNENVPEGIVVDSMNNVMVTGRSWRVGSQFDFLTIKYDSNGNESWVSRYDCPEHYIDRASAIAIDSSDNVYVTGFSSGTAGANSDCIVKYDSSGNENWVAIDNHPVVWARGIKVDNQGNIYITGNSTAIYNHLYGVTIKYCQFTNVDIDIKPGSFPNSINLGSNGNVPVAIFSTEIFDATTVDPLTVTLAGASVRIKGKGTPQASAEDVNGDGIVDLIVHVDTTALELTGKDTEAVLEGQAYEIYGGTKIRGVDTVRIVQE